MGARTIDEGSIDEKSGMNFSEYVAILSGNTDLLERARLEKKIAALESEKKAFGRNKTNSESKLLAINSKINGNNELISRMSKDWEAFSSRVQRDKDGNCINMIKLDGVESADVKVIAAKLAHIGEHANTQGNHYKIGTLYGFNLFVKTENSQKDELFKDNKFYAEGEGSIKYTYNNGKIANDPKLAVNYFLNALEKIPSLIKKYETETENLKNDVPVLQEIVNTTWRRENELKDLKTELAAIDRKIQLSLKPVDQSEETPSEAKEQKTSVPEQEKAITGKEMKVVVPGNGAKDDTAKDSEVIQGLLSGSVNPKDFFKTSLPSIPTEERLQQAKNEMGDRLVITSIPKYNSDNQSKGKKI